MKWTNSNPQPPTTRVAVLGANGQVGAELSLLLDIMNQVKPIESHSAD
jgi:hypothetical protein